MSDPDVRMVVLEGVARQAKGSQPTAKWRQLWQDAIAMLGPEEVRFWCRMQWERLADPAADEATLLASFWGMAPVAVHGTAAQLADWAWRLHKGDAHRYANAAIQALGDIAAGEGAVADNERDAWDAETSEDVPAAPVLADEAIGHLQRLKARIRHKVTARRIDQALTAVAAARGLSAEALQDLVVEDADLSPDGSRVWAAGPYDLYVFLTEDGEVELAIFERDTGRAMGAPPKALRQNHFAAYNEAKAVQKVLAETLATQKQRLEHALESQRAWSWSAWQQVFGRHPLMRHLARRLLWMVHLEGKLIDTAAFTGEELVDRMGDHVRVPGKGELTLLHPVLIEADALRGWQHHVVSGRMIQPFKQVFREVYRLPPEEAELRRTDRFAGQTVKHRQMYALLRGRGWRGLAGIGPLGYMGTKELPGVALSAVVGFRQFRHYGDRQRRQITLEGVEFYPHPTPTWSPGVELRLRLGEVPPVAFSEVMRDLALVVGVAGIGPEEALRGTGVARLHPTQGLLGGLTEARASLIRELLPMLGLDGQVKVEGDHARVESQGHVFLLHLTTGEVTLAEDGRRLDLEGIERTDAPLYLPYEGADAATASILSTLLFLSQFGNR